jgi:TIR domain
MAPRKSSKPQVRTFLSHKYNSVAANLYFWSILSGEAGFQFEVDEGKKAISVTRLELMIRQCDAIVGIFSFPGPDPAPSREDLIKESAYFRLETDIAIRSGKPTLLYIDSRFASIFPLPRTLRVQFFDAREIQSGIQPPSHQRFKEACQQFCREVVAYKEREFSKRDQIDPNHVAIVVSGNTPRSAYSDDVVDRIASVLEDHEIHSPRVIRFPDAKARFQLSTLDSVNWVVTDVGAELFRTGLVGYMHGRFIPMMRLFHNEGSATDSIGEHRCLHVGIEKGYDSDLVRWSDLDDLAKGVDERLRLLEWPRNLVVTEADANAYFNKASRRKELVFLSYSGEDEDVAAEISKALRTRFQDVFDYKDGQSIRPGEPWLSEIELNLRRATIGVQLLSPNYLASPHCQEEARIMNNLQNGKKLKVLPVKLKDERIAAPAWLTD